MQCMVRLSARRVDVARTLPVVPAKRAPAVTSTHGDAPLQVLAQDRNLSAWGLRGLMKSSMLSRILGQSTRYTIDEISMVSASLLAFIET
eukprot:274151-Amphidinium_carterae.2